MKTIAIFLILMSLNTFSSVIEGEKITAKKFNESSLSVGTIQQSLLTVSEFQSLQGNCWVLMDGRDVSNSDYGQIKKDSSSNQNLVVSLPDSRGLF